MIRDTNLQALPGQYRTNAQVPIGGVPPSSCFMAIIPGRHQALLLTTEGNSQAGKYPAAMWSPLVPRPILPNLGNLAMSYKFALGSDLAGMNVFETDVKLVQNCADGQKREANLSLQRHAVTGQIDIGNWTDTGLRMGPVTPDDEHDVTISYSFDIVKNVCSVLSYACDGIVKRITANMSMTPSTWLAGAYVQVQLGSMPNGLAWAVKLHDLDLAWS